MTMIVKFQCDDGEIFRRPLEQEPSFEAITEVVAACRPEVKANTLSEGLLKYVDDEGDLCTLTPTTFADFLDVQKKTNGRVLKLKLTMPKITSKPKMAAPDESERKAAPATPAAHTPSALPHNSIPDAKEESQDPCWFWKGKAKGKGKKGKKGKHIWKGWKGWHAHSADESQEEGVANDPATEFDESTPMKENSEDPTRAGGGRGHCGAPWRLLCTLRVLREVGVLTPALFASLAVHWLPFLIKKAAKKVDKINNMAAEGLDSTLEKILKIIQEQAAATPGLEQHAEVLAEVLSGDNAERHLGEALVELLSALGGLGIEAQTQFFENLASALLPSLEDTCPTGFGPGAWGAGHHRSAPWRLLCTLHVLPEVGMLTQSMFASLALHWLPFLAERAAAKLEEINNMAAEGLDSTLEKILKIIQEQAAATPGLEQHAEVLAEVLSGDNAERHLGEALVELLSALGGLGIEAQTQFFENLASALLPCLKDLNIWSKGKGCGKGKKGKCGKCGKHMGKGCDPTEKPESQEEPTTAPASTPADEPQVQTPSVEAKEEKAELATDDKEPEVPQPGVEAEDSWANGVGAEEWGAWHGAGCHGGGPRNLLWTLRTLQDVGVLTPGMFASLAVQWLPFLIHFAERKLDKINRMGVEGLDPTMQKILEIIQEEAAATPGMEQHAALISEAVSGDNGQRRLGEALLEMLRGLSGLGVEVQTRFCENVASALLPCLEELHSRKGKCKGKGKGKGKKGKPMWKGWHPYHAFAAFTGNPEEHTEEPDTAISGDDEFEKKVATLLELQVANEEVIRQLLMAHNGDLAQVTELLTS